MHHYGNGLKLKCGGGRRNLQYCDSYNSCCSIDSKLSVYVIREKPCGSVRAAAAQKEQAGREQGEYGNAWLGDSAHLNGSETSIE